MILHIIRTLGVKGGVGYAYEYAGAVFDRMSMEERMTVCNMSIEGGARCGYVNPDQTTFDYLRGRPVRARRARRSTSAVAWWKSMASDAGRRRTTTVTRLDGASLAPAVTWGINPGQAIGVDERIPAAGDFAADERERRRGRLRLHGLEAGHADRRDEDRRRLHRLVHQRPPLRPARGGARRQARQGEAAREGARRAGLAGGRARRRRRKACDEVFRAAGFEWRLPGCSMCLAMNPDKLVGRQVCASSSNRNFKGRQGSPSGRTLLMSPAMVAAAAIEGAVTRRSRRCWEGGRDERAGEDHARSAAGRSRCAATTSTPTASSRPAT